MTVSTSRSPVIRLVFLVGVLVLAAGAALAQAGTEKRVALVIGNANYDYVPRLVNPANDAADIAAALARLDFAVTRRLDLDYRQTRLALRDFAEAAQDADIALVYFAGHGIEVDRDNYMVPVNAELKSDRDVDFEAIPLDTMLRAVSGARGLRLVLVDACRNNPFAPGMTRTIATRSVGHGLGRIDPVGGVLVGYAAREGTLALDGQGRNSPYAQALLQHIEEPGLEIGKLFRKVRDTVYQITGGRQEPYTYGSLPGVDIYLKPPEVQQAAANDTGVEAPNGIVTAYLRADQAGTIEGWNAFLKEFAEDAAHPLVKRAENKRAALRKGAQQDRRASSGLNADAQKIQNELIVYSAAERLDTPRGWALYFDQFQTGRLRQSAIAREETALLSDIRARVYGRYHSAADGETMNAGMRRAGLDLIAMPAERVRQMQWALKSRGNTIGAVDGQIGPRTIQALTAVQRANGLPATGLPTRATLAALGQIDSGFPTRDLFATSGAIARSIDPETASALERDRRVTRLLEVFRGRDLIYGTFDGRLYAAVYLGTTIGEPQLDRYLDDIGGTLVEIDNPQEQRFVVDMIRFDQKMWLRGAGQINRDYGPTIGLGRTGAGQWAWRSGAALGYTAWAPGEPKPASSVRYGRLVPAGTLPRNAVQVGDARWGTTDNLAHTIIVEIE